MRRLAAAAIAAGLLAPAAPAQSVVESGFRYVRALEGPTGVVSFEPDGPLFAHSQLELADLRIVDSAGRQVPWRTYPSSSLAQPPRAVRVLNSGVRNGKAVALLDLGRAPGVHDQVVLDIPDTDFVGRVDVRGSDRRQGPFTFLSTTVVYDISGAPPARSTTAVYPPSDFRYLSLGATDVSAIMGASVLTGRPQRPDLLERALRSFTVASELKRTIATADLGFRNMPVDEVRVRARTKLYDRPIRVEGSNGGDAWALLAQGRVFRFPGSVETTIPLASRHRYLRLTIENGDDRPLDHIGVAPHAFSRPLLAEGGHPGPVRAFYGNPSARPSSYDFARLPAPGPRARAYGFLGPERMNALFEPPPATRSITARHPALVIATLVFVVLAGAAAGLLALRRRT